MPSSKHWGDPDDIEFYDDNGNVIYYDRNGKLRSFRTSDLEYQQMYHYNEEDN